VVSVDKMCVDEMSVDKMSFDEMSQYQKMNDHELEFHFEKNFLIRSRVAIHKHS
jgi:hypothetical protein